MKVDIQKTSGKVSGKKITLSDKIFSIEPNDHWQTKDKELVK